MTKQNRNTWLFIGFLLLAGVLHSRDPDTYHFLVSIEYCAEYLIYAGLILSWTQSVNRRLLPTREKGYVLAAACLMLLFLAAQFTKYRIAVEPGIIRYCWYVYYIPILFIPTLFLMTCFRLFRGTGRGKVDEFLFLIPAGLLALGVLTNDLHMLAFIPNEDIKSLIGSPRTYTHGFLYYAAYGWAGCALAAGILFLLLACRKKGKWKKAIRPLGMLVLIPDKELKPAFRTSAPIPATEEQLQSALSSPVCPTPETRLSGMKIRAGYAFWTEDESAVNRLNEELREANETLALENELLERDRELTDEQAGIDERSRLYRQAAQEVYPTQKKISGILKNAQPGTVSFRSEIEKALVLTAYVKRKANFVLVEAERETVLASELASALEESAHYLWYCGLNAVVDIRAERPFPCREAMAAYDCFEAFAESLLGKTKEFFIRLQDGELLMMADGGKLAQEDLPDLTGLSLPVRQSFEDGQIILRAVLGGGTV